MKRKLFVMETNSTVEMDEDIAKASSAPRSKISLIDLHDHYPPPPNPQTIIAISNSIQEDVDEISKKEQLHLNALRQRALASMIKKPPSLVPPSLVTPSTLSSTEHITKSGPNAGAVSSKSADRSNNNNNNSNNLHHNHTLISKTVLTGSTTTIASAVTPVPTNARLSLREVPTNAILNSTHGSGPIALTRTLPTSQSLTSTDKAPPSPSPSLPPHTASQGFKGSLAGCIDVNAFLIDCLSTSAATAQSNTDTHRDGGEMRKEVNDSTSKDLATRPDKVIMTSVKTPLMKSSSVISKTKTPILALNHNRTLNNKQIHTNEPIPRLVFYFERNEILNVKKLGALHGGGTMTDSISSYVSTANVLPKPILTYWSGNGNGNGNAKVDRVVDDTNAVVKASSYHSGSKETSTTSASSLSSRSTSMVGEIERLKLAIKHQEERIILQKREKALRSVLEKKRKIRKSSGSDSPDYSREESATSTSVSPSLVVPLPHTHVDFDKGEDASLQTFADKNSMISMTVESTSADESLIQSNSVPTFSSELNCLSSTMEQKLHVPSRNQVNVNISTNDTNNSAKKSRKDCVDSTASIHVRIV